MRSQTHQEYTQRRTCSSVWDTEMGTLSRFHRPVSKVPPAKGPDVPGLHYRPAVVFRHEARTRLPAGLQEGAPEGLTYGKPGQRYTVDGASRKDQGKGLRAQRRSHLMCRERMEKKCRVPRNSRKELVPGGWGIMA